MFAPDIEEGRIMKVGDIVIFNKKDHRSYSGSFYGALGRVMKVNFSYVQVRWCHEIDYEGMKPTISNFAQECFEVLK